jgi:hypothetical protein
VREIDRIGSMSTSKPIFGIGGFEPSGCAADMTSRYMTPQGALTTSEHVTFNYERKHGLSLVTRGYVSVIPFETNSV